MTPSFKKIANDASVSWAKHSPGDMGLVRKYLIGAPFEAFPLVPFSFLLECCLLPSHLRVPRGCLYIMIPWQYLPCGLNNSPSKQIFASSEAT